MNKRDKICKYAPLWGNWEVEEQLGKGNFGTVYKVSRKSYEKKYVSAVKFITIPTKEQVNSVFVSKNYNNDRDLTKHFSGMVSELINEIDLLYKLRGHSNIVSYEDHMVIEHKEGVGWDVLIRMECVKSLAEHIRKFDLTLGDVIKIGIDICTALETCHSLGIIHRDIKEGNLFISDKGMYKLGDFSVSKSLINTVSTGTKVGTIQYMSPEIMNGKPYTANIDVYSLGLVLYKFMNYGRPPFYPKYPAEFTADDVEKSQFKRLMGEGIPLPQVAEREFGSIIKKACESVPERRYQTATEFKNKLIAVLQKYSKQDLNRIVLSVNEEKIYNINKMLLKDYRLSNTVTIKKVEKKPREISEELKDRIRKKIETTIVSYKTKRMESENAKRNNLIKNLCKGIFNNPKIENSYYNRIKQVLMAKKEAILVGFVTAIITIIVFYLMFYILFLQK